MANRALKKEMLGCFVPAFASFSGDSRVSVPQPPPPQLPVVSVELPCSRTVAFQCWLKWSVICTAACEEGSSKNRLTMA